MILTSFRAIHRILASFWTDSRMQPIDDRFVLALQTHDQSNLVDATV